MAEQAGVLRSSVANIMVRVIKMEGHSITSTPTQYAVENAESIIDHVNLNPNVVQIQCEMPNSYNGGNGPEQARNVMQQFAQMREKREAIQLLTEHASYKNMVLVAFRPVHQAPFRGALMIDLVFHQVGVFGKTGLISAAGGRSPDILAQDGTQAVACSYVNAGEIPPITSGATLNACGRKLSGGAA